MRHATSISPLVCPLCGSPKMWKAKKCRACEDKRRRDRLPTTFWSKVQKGSPDECWIWTGSRDRNGYGRYSITHGRRDRAHRIAYQLMVGPIPDGLLVCHKCDNPLCCNPNHFFLGTYHDNSQDMKMKGRYHRPFAKEIVLEIKKLISEGLPIQQLAEQFGCRPQTISNIKNGKTWGGVA